MGLHRTLRTQVPPKLFRDRSSCLVLPEAMAINWILDNRGGRSTHEIYVDLVSYGVYTIGHMFLPRLHAIHLHCIPQRMDLVPKIRT